MVVSPSRASCDHRYNSGEEPEVDEDDHDSESPHDPYRAWDFPEPPPAPAEAEPGDPGASGPSDPEGEPAEVGRPGLELSDLGRPDGEQWGAGPTTSLASDDPLTATFAVSESRSEVAQTRRRRPGFGKGRWLVIAVAALFVASGAGVGFKLFALRGSSDVLEQMVPADSDVYA